MDGNPNLKIENPLSSKSGDPHALRLLPLIPILSQLPVPVFRHYSTLGDRKQALSYLDRSLQLGPGDKDLLLNAAVVYNQLHETGPALEWLSKALAAGYSRSVIATGAPFDNLHDNPRYQALMQAK